MKSRHKAGEVRPRRGAILVTRDDRGRVLLVKQRAGPFAGAWLLPGGALEDGESFEDAMRREVREETGLDVSAPHPLCRYDVRVGDFHGEVALFAGTVSGEPRVGSDGEETGWAVVSAAEAHPVLLRELSDAAAIYVDPDVLEERLTRAGIWMTRL